MLLAVFALAEITEGGVDTWGVLYLRNHLATGVLLGAGAYVVGPAGGGHDPRRRRSPARPALHPAGPRSPAAASPGPASFSSRSPPCRAWPRSGLALGAGGASLFWPLVMSTVSRMASQVVSAVGAFTAAGYVGWVAGAPIVGWISQNLGPARGLQVLALASFGVAVCTLLSPRRREGAQASG